MARKRRFRSDSDTDDFIVDSDDSAPRSKRRRAQPAKTRKGAHSSKRPVKLPTPPESTEDVHVVESYGVIPDWRSLPYHVLVNIFESCDCWPRNWLAKTATTCKAFTEPALAAFYKSPTIRSLGECKLLLDLLHRKTSSLTIDYKIKIKHLQLYSFEIPVSDMKGEHLQRLENLLGVMPQLSSCEIIDRPRMESYTHTRSWKYPSDLFHAFKSRQTPLRSWSWYGGNFKDYHRDSKNRFRLMKQCHESRSFEGLKRLAISRVMIGCRGNEDQENVLLHLANCINPLRGLHDLSIGSETGTDWTSLTKLNCPLTRIALTDNSGLDSTSLEKILQAQGYKLKHLIVKNNPGLDSSFLTSLKYHCPSLETLVVDDTHGSTRPFFKEHSQSTPMWPSTLRTLELIHLRYCHSTAAQTLLQSLLSQAQDLSNLRNIVIKAIIDISWKDRADFRNVWLHRVYEVYKRRNTSPPDPRLASFKTFHLWKAGECRRKQDAQVAAQLTSSPLRRSTRAPRQARHNIGSFVHDDASAEEDCTDVSPPNSINKTFRQESILSSNQYVQGMCDIVDLSVDNTRPSEMRFNEGDFMDSEPSGDEDWDEHRGV